MKSVIPFTKDLDFKGKISEITSISLEREFEVNKDSIDGFLFVTGDYKSHEISANVIPFSFKIPFTIEIPENLEKESITLEISDFAYDLLEETKIKVNIELELEGKEETKEENILEEESESPDEIIELNPDEIIKMMEEEREKVEEKEEQEEEKVDIEKKERKDVLTEAEEQEEKEEIIEILPKDDLEEKEERVESEDLILENITNEEEYATYHIHIIKDGESIETICTMYNSNLNMLSEYNDLTNITAGEKLIIPENNE